MIRRWQSAQLIRKMEYRRGVHLTGVRQSGKSTLAGMFSEGSCRRYTLDDRMALDVARRDPYGFVRRSGGETLIIDEVQKAPELLDAIKIVVDADNSRGQYLLTGSSNLLFAKAVKDSLAGRFGKVRLRPLAYGEILGNRPDFLNAVFAGELSPSYPDADKRAIISAAMRGGYPETLDFSGHGRREWFREYLDDILGKDVRDVTEVRKLDVLHALALWLTTHSAQFFSTEEAAAKMGVSKKTVHNYISALKALYIFDSVPAWSKSDYAMLGKRPKWISCDTGLMAAVMGWSAEELYLDESKSGKFIESWVYQQLAAIAESSGEYAISHYRDNNKREIDFIVERDDGMLLGVEVKAGKFSTGDFRHLRWFAQNMAKKPFLGVVLYSGANVYDFGDGMLAVPLSALGGRP